MTKLERYEKRLARYRKKENEIAMGRYVCSRCAYIRHDHARLYRIIVRLIGDHPICPEFAPRYWSLHTADPGTTGANEVTGGTYARQADTFGHP